MENNFGQKKFRLLGELPTILNFSKRYVDNSANFL